MCPLESAGRFIRLVDAAKTGQIIRGITWIPSTCQLHMTLVTGDAAIMAAIGGIKNIYKPSPVTMGLTHESCTDEGPNELPDISNKQQMQYIEYIQKHA